MININEAAQAATKRVVSYVNHSAGQHMRAIRKRIDAERLRLRKEEADMKWPTMLAAEKGVQ